MAKKADEQKWEELRDADISELYDELFDRKDETEFEMDASHAKVLKYLIKKYYPELEGHLEAYVELHGDDYNPMHPNETAEEFWEHED